MPVAFSGGSSEKAVPARRVDAVHDVVLLVERLHRRFLDIVRLELQRRNIREINAPQALVLANIGDSEVLIRDLIERGYYLGPNITYCIRKLVDYGYLEQRRDEHDKRAVRVWLTEKGRELVPSVRDLGSLHAESMKEAELDPEKLEITSQTLRKIERMWSDLVRYHPL
ncbi:MAG TPA: winged helix DNA-binding protein [Alphaproteobacteria bacterium]|nr:winged helix DNA-binding protein [Alphaproteobacteria bacterium]